jgi:hypothetical protein
VFAWYVPIDAAGVIFQIGGGLEIMIPGLITVPGAHMVPETIVTCVAPGWRQGESVARGLPRLVPSFSALVATAHGREARK